MELERQGRGGRGGEGVGAQRRADHRVEQAQDAILVDRLDARERRLDLVRQRLGALCVARLGIVQRAETLDQLRGQFGRVAQRSEEHTSELQSLMRISYAVFCLKKKTNLCLNKITLTC